MLLVIGTVLLVVAATPVAAAPITVPTSLSPGDPYRLAFVSSITRDATSEDIADYNTFVTNAANAVQKLLDLGTIWTAIASTPSVDARFNTDTLPVSAGGPVGVPIFLLNDTLLVDNYDDLWDGSIDPPLQMGLDITESGDFGYPFGELVWTGTGPDGLRFPDGGIFAGRALGRLFPQFGETSPSSAGPRGLNWEEHNSVPPAAALLTPAVYTILPLRFRVRPNIGRPQRIAPRGILWPRIPGLTAVAGVRAPRRPTTEPQPDLNQSVTRSTVACRPISGDSLTGNSVNSV